jgi:hypothetical protein
VLTREIADSMNLHIARGDQKFGPYSLAKAQGLLDAGTIKATDLAWHKSLPGWVPLCQIDGLTFAAPRRPVWVWIICGVYLALVLWGLGVMLWLYLQLPKPSSPGSSHVHINYLSIVVSSVLNLAKLAGIVLLFRLRRSALYVLGGVFVASLLFTAYRMGGLLLHDSYSPLVNAQLVFVAAVNLIMLAYVWHLFRTGVLR